MRFISLCLCKCRYEIIRNKGKLKLLTFGSMEGSLVFLVVHEKAPLSLTVDEEIAKDLGSAG